MLIAYPLNKFLKNVPKKSLEKRDGNLHIFFLPMFIKLVLLTTFICAFLKTFSTDFRFLNQREI
jgi:hypothetical protein